MNINHLSDVQNKKDTRGLPIQRVGIKELSYPVRFNNLNHSQLSHGTFNLSVHVSADQKGAHLSRFITLLQYYHERDSLVVSLETLPLWHRRMLTQLESEEGFFSCSFKIFLEKKAPISGLSSLMDYQITLSRCGSLLTSYTEIQIHIPVTSLCPCSKEISNYGAHNQRSIIIVSARTSESFNIAHLINLVEQQSSCELFSLLKRTDEKYVTEKAYENPKFSEDIVRDSLLAIKKDFSFLTHLSISSEHIESIHNHNAYAIIFDDIS